jgi:hypothetical protein
MENQQVKTTGTKAPISERVSEKVMPLTRWFAEQYYQTHALMSKDPRYAKLPPYNQTSCIATVIIATNAALDKNRDKRDAKKDAEKLEQISKTSTAERKSA